MVLSGLYDPGRISMAMEWKQNGLVGMLGLGEDDPRVESMLTTLAGKEDALLLLEGGEGWNNKKTDISSHMRTCYNYCGCSFVVH